MSNKSHVVGILVLLLVLLSACSRNAADAGVTAQSAQQTSIAGTVVAERAIAQAVAATLTADVATVVTVAAPAVMPTPTAMLIWWRTPTVTRLIVTESDVDVTGTPLPLPTPTATRLVIAESDVDGDDGNDFLRSSSRSNAGRVVLLPGLPPVVPNPVIFQGQMALRVAVFDTRVGREDGAGIAEVTFQIIDNFSGDTVYDNTEESAPYCLFGGSEPLCSTLRFAQNNFQWPNGEPIYNGEYTAQIDILAQNDESTQWRWLFQIAGAREKPSENEEYSDFTGTWYTNFAEVTFQQSGNTISGTYQRYGYNETLVLNGTVSGNRWEGNFGNDPADQVTFTLSDDGNYLDGAWLYRTDGRWRQWCGVRIELGTLPAGCGFSGDWYTASDYAPADQPTATLQQIGPSVTGTFFNGSSQGTVTGELGQAGPAPHHTLSGTYEINGARNRFRWDLLDFNGEQFAGCWVNQEGAHSWCGWRDGANQPEQCLPTPQCP